MPTLFTPGLTDSAAGPIGAFIVQLAKEAGCKVIASAGSEAKLAFLRDIGADVVFNYKTEDMTEVLKREGPINLWVCSSTGLRAPSCFP